MEVSKAQIATGVADFLLKEVIPGIDDAPTRIIIDVAASFIRDTPDALDQYLAGYLAAVKVGENYELSKLSKLVAAAIDRQGKITVTIPAIRFVSPKDKILQFGAEDVKRLVSLIEGR